MEKRSYGIHLAVLLPQALLFGLLLALLGLSFAQGETGFKIGLLLLLLCSIGALLLVSFLRRLQIDEQGITIKSPWRKQHFAWEEITSVEAARIRSRAYLTVCAGERFGMVPSSFAQFDQFLLELKKALPEERFAKEARQLFEQAPSAAASTIPFWFGILALVYILYSQLSA